MEENLVVIRNHVRNSIAIISHRSKPTTRRNLCADQKNVKIKIKYLKSQMTMLFFEVFLFTKKIIFSRCIKGKFNFQKIYYCYKYYNCEPKHFATKYWHGSWSNTDIPYWQLLNVHQLVREIWWIKVLQNNSTIVKNTSLIMLLGLKSCMWYVNIQIHQCVSQEFIVSAWDLYLGTCPSAIGQFFPTLSNSLRSLNL